MPDGLHRSAIVTVAASLLVASFATASPPLPRELAERRAFDYLRDHEAALGLTANDVQDVVITDLHSSAHNGLTYLYLRQRHQGIEIPGAEITLYVTADGRVDHVGHQLLSALASRVEPRAPSLSAADAWARAASEIALSPAERAPALPASLVYHTMADGGLRLAWELVIDAHEEPRFCGRVVVDAASGETLDRTSWTGSLLPGGSAPAFTGPVSDAPAASKSMSPDGYRVFAMPKEHPDDGPRTFVIDPALAGGAASPFGWHDTNGAAGAEYTGTRGNNAYAYPDIDGNNAPDLIGVPDGGAALVFDFPLDLSQAPSANRPAAVTHAFYVTNVVHDVLWRYGFTEAAGSFQANNYGRGGTGNDAVNVEIQDGNAPNNANMTTTIDGQAPRMQLGLFNATTPNRDAALANGVIVDVYAWAVAERLVGGSAAVCLNAVESVGMRWGWADWISLVLTADATDTENTPRGLGTYVAGQPANGPGIRTRPYTTDFAVNDLTHGDVAGTSGNAHAIGTVWATMLWQLYWELVDAHGFNPDLSGDWTTGGNNLALQLVLDGMKLAPCNPGFVNARDAILSADAVLTGGANGCAIWRAFAERGLGVDATQGSSNSYTDGTESFDIPAACVGVAVEDERPGSGAALRVHPNPFGPRTHLSFSLAARGEAALEIYDLHGRRVRRIAGGVMDAGRHQCVWDGRGDGDEALASGQYLVRLAIGGEPAATRKVVLVK